MKVLITNEMPAHQYPGVLICPERGDNIYDLNRYIDHNECSDIYFCLPNFIKTPLLKAYFGELAAKLAHKGKLHVMGTDAIEITKAFYLGNIDILKFNTLVYGERDKVWNFKQSLVSLHDIVELMKLSGLKIIQKRLNEFSFYVVGERE